MNYPEARRNYEQARQIAAEADSRHLHQAQFYALKMHEAREAAEELEEAKDALIRANVPPHELDQAVRRVTKAKDAYQHARDAAGALGEIPEVPFSVTDALSTTTSAFHKAIVEQELQAIPEDALLALRRAFSIWGGGGNHRWSDFLAYALPMSMVPTLPEIQALRAEVLGSHGVKP